MDVLERMVRYRSNMKNKIQKNNIDTIVEVDKFNPFHDARGRFASANSFSTYSANPKSKAGAMAISRSYGGGHTRTLNVHRESKGEDIGQNYRWLQTGQKPRIPASRTSGSVQSRARYGPGHPSNQTASKPKQTRTTKPKQQNQTQQQNSSSKPSSHKMATGKDISKTFKYDPKKGGSALDQVAELQGYKGKGRVVKDINEFKAAIKASGKVMYRTVTDGRDVTTGKRKSATQYIDDIKNSDNFSHNGTGGKVYGYGMYTASNSNAQKGKMPSKNSQYNAANDSILYGNGPQSSKTVAMTLDPSAKIADYNTIYSDFLKLSQTERRKFGDVGAYAASKGYDALNTTTYGCDYTVVYNRSKLIFFDQTFDAAHAGYNQFNAMAIGVPTF